MWEVSRLDLQRIVAVFVKENEALALFKPSAQYAADPAFGNLVLHLFCEVPLR